MGQAEYLIIIVNLVLGLGCAFPVAKLLANVSPKPTKFLGLYSVLVGVYFIECVAFSAGMATNVFTIGLAFVWGAIFGIWSQCSLSPRHEILKSALGFSIYTSLPAVSFLSLIPLLFFNGWPLLTVEGGARFGVPDFIPWPANTLLGFFGIVATSAVIFKTIITTGEIILLLQRKEKPASMAPN